MARRKTETAVFRVNIAVPVGATMQDCENYIREAVQNHRVLNTKQGGETYPKILGPIRDDHPILNLDPSLVRVMLVERHTHYVDSGNPNGNRRTNGKPSADPSRGGSSSA